MIKTQDYYLKEIFTSGAIGDMTQRGLLMIEIKRIKGKFVITKMRQSGMCSEMCAISGFIFIYLYLVVFFLL